MRRPAATAAAGGALLALSSVAGHVSADEWGVQDSDTGAAPDGVNHRHCLDGSVPSSLDNNINWAMNESLADAGVPTPAREGCTLSTDIVWIERNLTGSTGQAPCDSYHTSGTFDGLCDRYHVSIDLAAVNDGPNDDLDQTQTACHEAGHTV